MALDDIDVIAMRNQNKKGGTDYEALLILQNEFRKIADALKQVEITNLDDISISNLDEIKAHLRNELRPVITAIDSLAKAMKKAPAAPSGPKLAYEIKIPDIIKLADFDALKKSITDLAVILKGKEFSPKIDVNVPDVIVPEIKVPDIKIPEIKVPTPQVTINRDVAIDLSELLEALEPLKFLSNQASKPISVRLSDGQKFIKALQAVADKAGQVVHAFATSSGISKDEYKAAQSELNKASTATNTYATVGVASSVISAAKNRISIILVNDSDTTVYLAKGGTAVLNSGIRLNALGGAVVIEDWNGAIAAISSVANKNLCICETV